jgi:hypothetical protein
MRDLIAPLSILLVAAGVTFVAMRRAGPARLGRWADRFGAWMRGGSAPKRKRRRRVSVRRRPRRKGRWPTNFPDPAE